MFAYNSIWVKQTFRADGNYQIFERYIGGGSWTDWKELALQDDVNQAVRVRGAAKIDCNEIKQAGIIRTSSESSNCPSGNYNGVLITFPALGDVVVQLYVFYSGGTSARCCWYGTWSSWVTLG